MISERSALIFPESEEKFYQETFFPSDDVFNKTILVTSNKKIFIFDASIKLRSVRNLILKSEVVFY